MSERRWTDRAVIAAVGVGFAASAAGLVLSPISLVRAWHVAASSLIGLPLGALVVLAIYRLTGGRWGQWSEPALVALGGLLPAALMIEMPVLLGIDLLLPFVHTAPDQLSDRVALKLSYLQPSWMVVRAFLTAGLWLAAQWLMRLTTWPVALAQKPATVLALVLYAIATTMFTTDWMQALEPEFISTIYPMLVASTQIQAALAGVTLILCLSAASTSRSDRAAPLDDLGKLLLAGVLTWVYLAYMQWLIIWMGNLPPEAAWYLRRDQPAWLAAFWGMALLFALLPFLALLIGAVRSNPRPLAIVAGMLLTGYICESVWRVAPAFLADPAFLTLLIASFVAQGSVLVILLRRRLGQRARAEMQHV